MTNGCMTDVYNEYCDCALCFYKQRSISIFEEVRQ